MHKSLNTVSEVIKALGGTKAACAILGVGQSAIGNWRGGNVLPPHTFPTISQELLKRGLYADIALWRWDRKRKADGDA
jgi:hypothetical protein